MKNQYFTVGPAQLFFSVEGHLKQAFKSEVPSISHRSAEFSSIFQHTSEMLRTLFNLPESHNIVFTSSATEVWERLIQNCVINESFHLVNGAFSEKFANISENLGRHIMTDVAPWGECVDVEKVLIPETSELIAITHNETSTGASYPEKDIYKLAHAFPEKIIAVDITSSAPMVNLDWSVIDTAYFSVQKAFGLPAGLGIWIFNDQCLSKSYELLDKNKAIGSYHSLPELYKYMQKNQTPETPNMLAIYLLGKVTEDMLDLGMERLHRESIYKSAVLYQAIEETDGLDPFIKDRDYRSKTTLVVDGSRAQRLKEYLVKKHILISSGYGPKKHEHVRIANFPTHSKELIEMLADLIVKGEF